MQVLIALPDPAEFPSPRACAEAVSRKVCGVPLLARVLVTAKRSGASKALLLAPKALPESAWAPQLRTSQLADLPIETVMLDKPFDPGSAADWQSIQERLESQVLWLPWNRAIDKRRLLRLTRKAQETNKGARFFWPAGSEKAPSPACPVAAEPLQHTPVVVEKRGLLEAPKSSAATNILADYASTPELESVPLPSAPGIAVLTAQQVAAAERDLVAWSGKDWDGVYSRFNRRLCWPIVRLLSKTPVTPNHVSWMGLVFALLAGFAYAQGYWLAYTAGALLFFVSVLFDEIDGMLARVTFKDSPFGCWLESFVDSASYVVLYAGITVGLYRQSGPFWLVMGGVMLVSAVLTLIIVAHQKTLATEPDTPDQHLPRFYNNLEKHSGNWISRQTRQVQFLLKKAPFAHHLLWCSALGIIKFHFLMSTLGATLAWMLGLYYTHLFRTTWKPAATTALSAKEMGEEA